jgi:DNA-binding CsgD family transcriptional regulator
VNNHISTIRRKLKVNSRSEAIAVALANGQINKSS